MSQIGGISSGGSDYFNSYLPKASDSKSGQIMNMGTSALGDLALIKSGTYKKLLNAYYGKTGSVQETPSEEVKAEQRNLVQAKDDAESLNKAVAELMKTDFSAENRETLTTNMKNFVKSYNSLIDSGSEVDAKKVLRNVLWMTQSSSVNSGLLTDAGISIGTDNKLSLDETKLAKTDSSVLKTLFTGKGSYADRILQKTSAVSSAAAKIVADGKSATAYTSSGSDFTQLSTGTMYKAIT